MRDLHLDAAGLLTREIGGPGIYPPLSGEVAKLSFRSNYIWTVSTGRDLYRRGMYVFYKRTLPHPNLDTFDCPDSITAVMRREISNTPLQALAALNTDYRTKRAGDVGMLAPRLVPLPPGTFYRWMGMRGKLGGQNKVPRVTNDRAVAEGLLRTAGMPDEAASPTVLA